MFLPWLLTGPPETPCSLSSAHASSPRGAPCTAKSARATQGTINSSLNHIQRLLPCPALPAHTWGSTSQEGMVTLGLHGIWHPRASVALTPLLCSLEVSGLGHLCQMLGHHQWILVGTGVCAGP